MWRWLRHRLRHTRQQSRIAISNKNLSSTYVLHYQTAPRSRTDVRPNPLAILLKCRQPLDAGSRPQR